MTEEPKKPKLTLNPKKLSLAQDAITAKSGLMAKNTVTVEVKRNQSVDSGRRTVTNLNSSGLTNVELSQRLNVLKNAERAALQRKQEANDKLFTKDFNHKEKLDENIVHQGHTSGVLELHESSVMNEVMPVIDGSVDSAIDKKDDIKKSHKVKAPLGKVVPGEIYKKDGLDEDEEAVALKKKNIEPDNKNKTFDKARKLNKVEILHMLDSDESELTKTRSLASIKRAREKEKRKQAQMNMQEKVAREVILPETIQVGELANRMSERVSDVIRELMKLGIIANASQEIEADVAEILVTGFGHSVKRVYENKAEDVFVAVNDKQEDLVLCAPVVTVMGHVDHGKTSLLDALKSTNIVSSERGGITQHIGAYRVELANNQAISFIDTPGHEAFTEMRSRGAKVTDIVVLVVAADDGVKAQTVEAIRHAQAAQVPIIVAINKMDKPAADPMRVKTELLSHNLVTEDFGGDVMCVEVSALQKKNLDRLEEIILLLAEMMNLKANPNTEASGSVIESRLDKGMGAVTTLLVQRGTLKIGDIVVAGTSYGRVRLLKDCNNLTIKSAGPSFPVEVTGLDQAPMAGEQFVVVKTEKQARDVADYREKKLRESSKRLASKMSLEDLFAKSTGVGKVKELPLIIKGDVQGSVEAIILSLGKFADLTNEVSLKILHSAAGAISESDLSLSHATGAIILAFNVRLNNNASTVFDKIGGDIRYYSIIYDLLNDVKLMMSGMLKPILREEYLGSVEIREVFNITKSGKIAGSYVLKGKIKRGAGVRLLRDNIVIHEGKLKTLKRFKDDVKEVAENFECGIAFENYENIAVGDKVEVFDIVEEKRVL